MHLPKTLCKSFALTADTPEGEKVLLSVDNNIKRAYHVAVPKGLEISGLKLRMLSNWGDTAETKAVSFDFSE